MQLRTQHDVGAALRSAETAKKRTSSCELTPQSAQQAWLTKAMSKSADDGAVVSSSGLTKAKLRWRAAGRVAVVSTRSTRRFADGKRRTSVKEGAKVEAEHAAHGHGPQGGLYFISSRAQAFLESTYTVLGGWIEKNHHAAMLIGVLLLVSGIPGTFFLSGAAQFLWFRVDSDLHAFALTSTDAYKQYEDIIHRHNGFFHPPRTALVVMSPKNNDKVLSFPFLHKALEIMNAVYNISMEDGGGTRYGFADLCLPSGDAPEHMWFDHSSHRQGGEHGSGEQGLNEADITYCASRAADIFAAPVNWDPVLLTELAGPNAVERRAGGTHDFGSVLEQRAIGRNLAMHDGFNATGAYQVNLKSVDASRSYTEWDPTTLQIALALAHPHAASRTQLAVAWETAMADYLTQDTYVHADDVGFSCASLDCWSRSPPPPPPSS